MKVLQSLIVLSFLFLIGCGTSEKPESEDSKTTTPPKSTITNTLENKGIGPVTSLTLADAIDTEMAEKGKETFDALCTACHKTDSRFIGPAPKGIFEKRSPEWVMNMILNPEEMVKEDPDAKKLLIEYNGAPMANQDLTEEEARAVLEYFRTL